MMKLIQTVVLCICASFGALRAQAGDALAGFYGNTWKLYGDHGVSTIYVNVDKTWSAAFEGGLKMSGTWIIEGGRVCFHAKDAPTHCDAAIFGRKPGETWSSVEDGEQHVSVINEGRAAADSATHSHAKGEKHQH